MTFDATLVLVERVGVAAGPADVEPRAVDFVLEQFLASAVAGELPNVGTDVARTGEWLADLSFLEGEHVT